MAGAGSGNSVGKKQWAGLAGVVLVAVGGYFGMPVPAAEEPCLCESLSRKVAALEAKVDQVDGKVDKLLDLALHN